MGEGEGERRRRGGGSAGVFGRGRRGWREGEGVGVREKEEGWERGGVRMGYTMRRKEGRSTVVSKILEERERWEFLFFSFYRFLFPNFSHRIYLSI